MPLISSNGPTNDLVASRYQALLHDSLEVFVASPYVTLTKDLAEASSNGKSVSLLVGLNSSTDPACLKAILGKPNVAIRYYTSRFHAKIYLFDMCALVGSSNLTDGGMHSNREATVQLDDPHEVQEIRALCQELWSGAPVLTPDVLVKFESSAGPFGKRYDPDWKIQQAVGKAEPATIIVGSAKKSSEYIFLESLRRRVWEQYKPAFDYVELMLSTSGMHRQNWNSDEQGSETNHFLNWLRLTHGAGDEWRKGPVPPLSADQIQQRMNVYGPEWSSTDSPRIWASYFESFKQLRRVFRDKNSLASATKEELSQALMSINAFHEQIRFIKGGSAAILNFFWEQNDEDLLRVKRSLAHLLFDSGEFVKRLYDVLNFPQWKIKYFGESCALELCGTVKPAMCPPVNGRSAKALYFLGFKVDAK